MLTSKKEEQDNGLEAVPDGSAPFNEPLDYEVSTVPEIVYPDWGAVGATVEETVHPAVEEPYVSTVFGDLKNGPQQDEAVSAEASKKEMIRGLCRNWESGVLLLGQRRRTINQRLTWPPSCFMYAARSAENNINPL